MADAPHRQAERRELRWDNWLSHRPRCGDCGQPITEERCLVLESGTVLCPRCVRWRMTEIEERE